MYLSLRNLWKGIQRGTTQNFPINYNIKTGRKIVKNNKINVKIHY